MTDRKIEILLQTADEETVWKAYKQAEEENMLKKLLRRLDNAVAQTNRLDDKWSADPHNKGLEKAWNMAYKSEYEAHKAFSKALIEASGGRLTSENVRALYFTRHDELKALIDRLEVAA